MSLIETLVVIVHVLVAFAVVGLVLIQQGKGADAGASFGGGASQTVFGSQGGVGFLVKLTSGLAFLFFLSSFVLAVFAKQKATLAAQEAGIPAAIEVPAQTGDSAAPVVEPKTAADGRPVSAPVDAAKQEEPVRQEGAPALE